MKAKLTIIDETGKEKDIELIVTSIEQCCMYPGASTREYNVRGVEELPIIPWVEDKPQLPPLNQ